MGVRRIGSVVIVIVTIAAACALLQVYGLWRTPFHTKGEPREAVVVQDLVRRGDWILPRRNAEQLPRKPPLFYWLGGIVAHLRGAVDETAVRLPSAILSGAACALVGGVVTPLYGPVAGVVTGLSLLTSFEWERAATSARVDMSLAFGLTLAFVGLLQFRRVERPTWLLLFYAGVAWATLSKGIPGLAIPTLQVLLLCLVDRSPRFALRLRPVVGLAAVLLVTGAWYAAAAAQGGGAFLRIVANENFVRVVGEPRFTLGHRHSVRYLAAALLAGLLPWTVVLPSAAVALWRNRRTIDHRDPRLFCVLWIIAVFAPHAVAASKRGVYLLPLYPAVCFLIGWWAANVARQPTTAPWVARLVGGLGWTLAAAGGILTVVALAQGLGLGVLDTVARAVDPRTASDIAHVAQMGSAAWMRLAAFFALATVAALALSSGGGAGRWDIVVIAMPILTAALILSVRLILLPAVAAGQTPRGFADALHTVVAEPTDLRTAANLDYGLLFYWGQPIPLYDPADQAAAPPYLLTDAAARRRMTPAERRAYRVVPRLAIEPGGGQRYPTLLQRTDEPPRRSPEE